MNASIHEIARLSTLTLNKQAMVKACSVIWSGCNKNSEMK